MTQPVHFADGPGTRAMGSLVAATANGDGETVGAGRAYKTWAMQVVLGGGAVPTGGTVKLHLSFDGINWSEPVATFTIGTTVNKDIVFAVDKPAIYAKAVLASLSGGTNPTVSAKIVGV